MVSTIYLARPEDCPRQCAASLPSSGSALRRSSPLYSASSANRRRKRRLRCMQWRTRLYSDALPADHTNPHPSDTRRRPAEISRGKPVKTRVCFILSSERLCPHIGRSFTKAFAQTWSRPHHGQPPIRTSWREKNSLGHAARRTPADAEIEVRYALSHASRPISPPRAFDGPTDKIVHRLHESPIRSSPKVFH
jgi:hypothetical protein